MTIVVKSLSQQPNTTFEFDFDDTVANFVVGISYFNFTYGSDDHHVETLSLNINTSKPNDRTILADITGQLSDGSGNRIDNGDSTITAVCIAQVGSTDNNLTLATANSIPNGGSSNPIALPGNTLKFSQAGLSGFNLSYGSDDHHLQQLIAGTGFSQAGTSGSITASVSMQDSSGHEAQTATANGVLVAGTPSEMGLEIIPLNNQQSTGTVVATFSNEVSDAVVLLNKMNINYPGGDHHVKVIGAGTKSWSIDQGNAKNVVLSEAYAFISDDSGHSQDNGSSYVNMAVVGIPK